MMVQLFDQPLRTANTGVCGFSCSCFRLLRLSLIESDLNSTEMSDKAVNKNYNLIKCFCCILSIF